MASAPDVRRFALGLAATLATALLIGFGTGLNPYWPLMWLAPVPVLVFAVNARWWGAALVAGTAMMLGLLNLWELLHGALRVPPAILARLYLIEGVMFALAVLLFRTLARRGAYWSALLAFPAYWVSSEWFLNLASPHGTGGSLAYSQLRFLPFLQLASVTGPWGMTFLLCAFPAALAIAICLRNDSPRQGYRILLATAGVVTAVLAFGTVRLLIEPREVPVKVGLVASDGPNIAVADDGAPTARLLQAYADSVVRLAKQGAQVVVLPEKIGVVVEPDTGSADSQLQALADQTHTQVVVGVLRVVPPSAGNPVKTRYNEARIYTPGAPVESYDKEHMLPPFESNLTPGTALTFVRTKAGLTWGVAICKDMDFTQLSRRYGAAGAGLMLVPGWDFYLDWIQHGHMAVMRGVESGFSVVRAAKGGSLFVSDDRGRILAEIKSNAAPFSSLLVSAPQTHEKTLFLLLGDWFAWTAVAILVLCLAQLPRRRKAAKSAHPEAYSPTQVVPGRGAVDGHVGRHPSPYEVRGKG
jgi:apolipoprotein N-acyltransferase